MELNVGYVNLDPGCEYTPYKPDYDIRGLFTVSGIMKDEGLGPNGAMIRAAQLIDERSGEVVEGIEGINADLRLIDTPGQMEIFVFRPAGPRFIKKLMDLGKVIGIFIIDPEHSSTASGLVVAKMLGIAAQLRLEIPSVMVMNKVDMVKGGDIDRLLTDIKYLRARITEGFEGSLTDLALICSRIVEQLSQASRLVKVSAKTGEGMDMLYDLTHEAFCCCGDLT